MFDYILLSFSIGSILLAELYLRALSKANNIKVLWKLEVARLSLAILFIGTILVAYYLLAELINSYSLNLTFTSILPLFNFGAYLIVQWKRSIKILGSQNDKIS